MAIYDGNEIKAEYEYLRSKVKLLLTENIFGIHQNLKFRIILFK